MKKHLFEIKPIEYKKSFSVQETTDRYAPLLKPYKSKQIGDRPSIVIDNGSYECRAGWSFEESPYLRFRNLVAKPKTTVNKAIDSMHLVGDELNEFDSGKIQKRSMFDKNIIYHIQSLEHMLDYTFGHLGLQNESSIEYPLIMTEPLCNPNYCRSNVSELLFECYRASAVSYAVDSVLSFYYNAQKSEGDMFSQEHTSGLIISSSNQASHVIPIFNGQISLDNSKRLALGGSHHFDLLSKSLNLKYAQHKNTLSSPDTIQYIMENHTYCATNYREQLLFLESVYNEERQYQIEEDKKKNEALYGAQQNQQDTKNPEEAKLSKVTSFDTGRKLLLTYKNRTQRLNDLIESDDSLDLEDHTIQLPWQMVEAPSEEELKKRHEMRKEQGQKLKEIMQRKREEKKRKMEEELVDLESLESLREQKDMQGFKEEIEHRSLHNYDEYKKRVKMLQVKLGIKQPDEAKPNGGAEDKFNLLDQPDEFLTPEQLKMKRIQKMQKTASQMREERKIQLKQEREKIDEIKSSDPDAYLKQLYFKRKEILDRITERSRRKEEFSKRGSKAAQRRLQMMAELGIGEQESQQKKRGRPPNNQDQNNQNKEVDDVDTFGAADEDWDVYRGIAKDGFSEEEEDDQQALNELEEQIADLDPKFANLIYNTSKQPTAEDYQIRLWTDRYRGAEILFQPSILGMENAGLSEILENMLSPLTQAQREQILKYVLITGGHTKVPGFGKRIDAELRMLNKSGTPISIVKSYDEQLDAWRGGAWLAQNYFQGRSLQDFTITKAKYDECGHHYLKEHFCSNMLYGPRLGSAATTSARQSVEQTHGAPGKRLKA